MDLVLFKYLKSLHFEHVASETIHLLKISPILSNYTLNEKKKIHIMRTYLIKVYYCKNCKKSQCVLLTVTRIQLTEQLSTCPGDSYQDSTDRTAQYLSWWQLPGFNWQNSPVLVLVTVTRIQLTEQLSTCPGDSYQDSTDRTAQYLSWW